MLQMLEDRVLVEIVPADEKSEGGLFSKGTVIAVGPGLFQSGRFVPTTIEVDDTVLISKYAGSYVQLDGKDMLAIRESDILAIIDRPPSAAD